jgi:hypothetical protein
MKLREMLTLYFIVVAVVTLVYVLIVPMTYDTAELEEELPRNPWGQHLPLDMSELCDGTVLQWHTECVKRAEEAAKAEEEVEE